MDARKASIWLANSARSSAGTIESSVFAYRKCAAACPVAPARTRSVPRAISRRASWINCRSVFFRRSAWETLAHAGLIFPPLTDEDARRGILFAEERAYPVKINTLGLRLARFVGFRPPGHGLYTQSDRKIFHRLDQRVSLGARVIFYACAWLGLAAAASAAQGGLSVGVTVVNPDGRPLPGVRLRMREGPSPAEAATTDSFGRGEFKNIEPGRYELQASKDGYLSFSRKDLEISAESPSTFEVTLTPAEINRESVNVQGQAEALDLGASAPAAEFSGQVARDLPSRPATVSDALPLMPGIARQPGGGLQISGGGEHRSALIVNAADVTDPATGQFGLTVPIDSVDSMDVMQTPFLAEYGRFTAGLVSVATRRGGEKWKWTLNDPLPEFFIRSWHLRGLRDATPRLNAEGPIIPGKFYFSEGFEFETRKTPVFTLPFPDNLRRKQGVNSFAQFDWIASASHLVTGTVHLAPQRLQNANMDFYNPQSTTPDAATHNYTGTLADKVTLGGAILENTLSVTDFDARVWSKGPAPFGMTPWGNVGDYFAGQNRDAERYSARSVFSFAPWRGLGTHNVKVGGYIAHSGESGEVHESTIDLFDTFGRLDQGTTFTGGQRFNVKDTETALFGQDHWMVLPTLSVDIGGRLESQAVAGAFRVAPRAGISWSPLPSHGTVISAGYGYFFDRVPLSVYAFTDYPDRILTFYAPDGSISSGPFLYTNGLGEVLTNRRLVFKENGPGDFAPRSATWSVQIEQPVTHYLRLRTRYMSTLSDGLVILDRTSPDPATNTGADVISGIGQSRYRQLEFTARIRLNEKRELFASYVNSRARGDLNDFADFLGNFPLPVIRPNQFGTLPTDLPNRFLLWGAVQLPYRFRIAPTIEWRSGFPYASLNQFQRYADTPYTDHFPTFASIDARVSKDIQVNPKRAVRLSLNGFNLSNHFNPEAVRSNTANPLYGFFFGQRGRRFTVDFDVLF